MTFKEAGGSLGNFKVAGAEKVPDVPKSQWVWDRLEDEECPACGGALVLFTNVSLYKCPCGFKIGTRKLEEIVNKIDERLYEGRSSGFAMGNYDDEPPF